MATIEVLTRGAIRVLTIANEPKRNAFTHHMTTRLGACLDEADHDPAVRCVVITGAGDRAFSSGHDLNELMAHRDHAADPALNAPFSKPLKMTKPTIAAVNGAAHAGGFILALSCDMRVCDPKADFAAPGARIGLLPIGGQISHFPNLLPCGIAFELLATGRRMSAQEAAGLGFVNHVSASNAVLEHAVSLAREIAENSMTVVAGIKRGLAILTHDGADAAARFEWAEGRRLQSAPDADEGVRAFLEKRSPRFTDVAKRTSE